MEGDKIKVRRSEIDADSQADAVKIFKNIVNKIMTSDEEGKIKIPPKLNEFGDEHVSNMKNVNILTTKIIKKLKGNKSSKDGKIEIHPGYITCLIKTLNYTVKISTKTVLLKL